VQRRLGYILLALIVLVPLAILVLRPGREAGDGAPATRADVILITIDGLRCDHLGAYGSDRGLTPHIDALAEEGALFVDAVTPVPLTAPALASLWTGRVPIQHQVRGQLPPVGLSSEETTLAEVFRTAGYATGAFLSSSSLGEGLAQGFDSLDAPPGPLRPGAASVSAALEWLGSRPGRPCFLWAHIAEPEGPWRAPFPWSLRLIHDPYAAEVAAADGAVGDLIEGLRSLDRYTSSHIILLAPTGMACGDEGEIEHGVLLSESTLQVPWIWRFPDAEHRGGIIEGLVSITDLKPTVEAICRLPGTAGPTMEGHDLQTCLEDGDPSPRRQLLIETLGPLPYGWSALLGVRTTTHKLVLGSEARVYDLEQDPLGPMAAKAEAERRIEPMRRLLDEEIVRLCPGNLEAETWFEVIQGRPDPYPEIGLCAGLVKAARALQNGNPEAARRASMNLERRFPDSPRVHLLNGLILLTQGKVEEAQRRLRALLEPHPEAFDARVGLAECQLELGEPAQALITLGPWNPDSLDVRLPLLPPDPDLPFRFWRAQGLAQARVGDPETAAYAFQEAGRVAVRAGQVKSASRYDQAARFLGDVLKQPMRLQPVQYPLVVRSALDLDAPELGRRMVSEGLPATAPDRERNLARRLTGLLDARTAALKGRLQIADQILEQTQQDGVMELDDCIALAALQEKAGRRGDAIRTLERAVPAFPKSAELHFQLARVRAWERPQERALIHLETALRLGFQDWERLLQEPLRALCTSDRVAHYWGEAGPS